MSEKKRSLNSANVLGAVTLIVLIVLSAMLYIYIQQNSTLQDKDKQIASLQNQLATPKLVSINFTYTDNRSNSNAPFLHITGFAVNVGTAKANNCTIHVNAVQNGNITALDTTATITSLDAGKYETIDLQFPYTGQALEAYTSYLTWTN